MTKNKIVVIGAGKLAYSLISALQNTGSKVQFVVSRNKKSADALAKKFSIHSSSNSIKKIPVDVNIFFLTVPDGQIKKTADKISRLDRDFKECICVHFSGVENIDSLRSLAKKGCATGSLHIMQTFPTNKIVEIKNSPAAIETQDKRALKFLNQLCSRLRLKSFKINSEQKVFYHLAGVYSSNFLVGNLFNAFSLFKAKNKKPDEVLMKTSISAIENVFKLSPAKALSGPADRGDFYSIKKHIEAFENKIKQSGRKDKLKLLRLNYIIQTLALLEAAKEKYGKLNKDHLRIKKFLMKKLNANLNKKIST